MGNISKNFSYSEFEASETAKRYSIPNAITSALLRDSIKALVDNVLQPLRDVWGQALRINSGYRCPELNALVYGAEGSQHCKGEAADVACSNPYVLAKLVVSLGLPFDQMGLYPNFVHISHKFKGEQRGEIFYHRTYRGKRL